MKFSAWVPMVIAVLLGLLGSVYVVSEGESAIVLNLGKVVRSDVGPGLHFKIPFVESDRVFDQRLQVLDANPERYLTSDKQDISLDFFAIGRIADVRAFYRATGGDEEVAVQRLAPIIKNALTGEINSRTLQEVVSGDREKVVARQLSSINKGASTLGVHIIDIRIKRVDLPEDSNVLKSVYDQMRSQRQQVASQLRAEGLEAGKTIRADADRQVQVINAEAYRDAQKTRGEGDATASQTYASAYGKDAEFFAFYRSLEAYRDAFAVPNGTLVLDQKSEFLHYLQDSK